MRCLSCNTILTDYEATRKGANTGEFIDLCNHCFSYIKEDVSITDRQDLVENDELEMECDDD